MPRSVRSTPVVAVLAFGLLVGACGNGGGSAVHEIHADYPFYASASELTQSADLVVTATARKAVTVRRMAPQGVDLAALPAYKRAEVGVIVTDMEFSVVKTHKGTGGPTIVVTELGGKIGNSLYADDEQPTSRPGHQMLMFLQKQADGKYTVVGGPQGRYVSVNGVAKKLGTSAVPAPLEGKSVQNPDLTNTTRFVSPSGQPGPAISGNGGKSAVPGPPAD